MNRQPTSPNPYKVLFWCWLIYGVFYLGRFNIAVVLPLLREELGYSHGRAGLLVSGFYFVYAACQIPAGYLGDRFSPRLVVTIGALISSMANMGFSVSRSLASLLSFQGLNGLGQAGGWGPSIRILINWFPARRWGTAIGFFSTSVSLFTILAYLLAALVAAKWGWRYSFRVPAFIILLSAILYMFAISDRPSEDVRGKAPVPQPNGRFLPKYAPLRKTMISPDLWLVLGSYCALQYLNYGIIIWFPSYIHETFHVNLTKSVAIASIIPAMGIPARPLGGYLSDVLLKRRRKPMIAGGMAALFVLLLLLAWMSSLGRVAALLPFLGVAMQFFHPLYYALPAEILSSKAASTGSGFLDSGGHVASISATMITGWLIDITGSYRVVLLSFAMVALAGFLFSVRIPEKHGR